MAVAPSSGGTEWRSSVAIREVTELARELAARLPPANAARDVSVTDLIALRKAYWRGIAPVPLDPERQARIDIGRALHRRLGIALAAEGSLEARVRRDGVVGRIDLLSDVPVEVKTSSSSVAAEALTSSRPDQVEQLAMYCALADQTTGRLVTLVVGGAADGAIQAVDIDFGATEPIRAEMVERARALRHAWAAKSPAELPACRWYGRGCEFQGAGVCDCSGTEPATPPTILAGVRTLTERADVGSRIGARLSEVPVGNDPPRVERFRALLYPRRAYFERSSPAPPSTRPLRSPTEPLDAYGRVTAAAERGPVGEIALLPPRLLEPEEEVSGFRGAPYLVRSSRAQHRASAATLLDAQPQYALELGFRCVATGTDTAYLLLARERAAEDSDRLQVFEFRFSPSSAFSRIWRERVRQLEKSLTSGDPSELLPCPEWMFSDCPYRADCACGASGIRSQR